MSRKFYMVRLKPDEIDRTEESIKRNEICIGWGEIAKTNKDFNSLEQDMSSLKEELRNLYAENNERLLGKHAGEIVSFLELKNGDMVVVPMEMGQFKIAEVKEQQAKYDQSRLIFTKKVEFFEGVFSKEDAPSLIKSLTRLTVNNLGKHALTILSLIADQRKIIFFRIGNCKYYDGGNDDNPTGKMKYIEGDSGKRGHEVKNFLQNNGFAYGYARVGKLKLKEHFNKNCLVSENGIACLENMTVIWITADPDKIKSEQLGSQIAGWYENATIYSIPQNNGNYDNEKSEYIQYVVRSEFKNAHLINYNNRPKYESLYNDYCKKNGYRYEYDRQDLPGQSNVFYLYSKADKVDLEKRQILAECILEWIKDHHKNDITNPGDLKSVDSIKNALKVGSNGTSSKESQIFYYVSCIRGTKHNDAEKKFEKQLLKKDILDSNIHFNIDYIDCIYEDGQHCYFTEIKPYWNQISYKYALRSAVGQILEYFYNKKDQYRTNLEIKMVIALVKFGEEKIETNKEFEDMLKKKYEIDIQHIPSELAS